MPRKAVLSVLVFAMLRSATAWTQVRLGGEFQVNTYTTGYQGVPSVASDANGNFVVVWQSYGQDGNVEGAFGRRYDASGTALDAAEYRLNSYTTGTQREPAVAVDPTGHAIVVWDSIPQFGIFGQRYDPAGLPQGAEFRVSATSNAEWPTVAADANGSFVVVWDAGDGSSSGIYGRQFDSSGVARGPQFRINSYTTGSQDTAAVASDASGSFVVVWASDGEDGDSLGVFGQRFDALGAPRGAEFRVNSYTTSLQTIPSVASDTTGNFVVVWASNGQDGSGWGIVGRRYDAAGVTLGTEFIVNSFTTGTQHIPSVTWDATGSFVVVWQGAGDGGGGNSDVFGQRFDSAGARLGPEFRVNSHTTSDQLRARVASDASGNFVVAWHSLGQDGDNYGVFGQRFAPDVIFKSGFESGNLSGWSASATDGGDLSVSAAAALKSTAAGLQGVVNDTNGIYVEDDTPNNEDRYRARFYFDPNGFDPGEGQSHFRTRIFIAFEENPNRRLAALILKRQAGLYSLMGRCRLDDGSQADSGFLPISDGPHFVELDWKRSSAPSANDGSFELWIDGTSVANLSALDNSISSVDFVRMGALSVKTGASGAIYWDEFESRRESYIGP